jgi:hypothetical protein
MCWSWQKYGQARNLHSSEVAEELPHIIKNIWCTRKDYSNQDKNSTHGNYAEQAIPTSARTRAFSRILAQPVFPSR